MNKSKWLFAWIFFIVAAFFVLLQAGLLANLGGQGMGLSPMAAGVTTGNVVENNITQNTMPNLGTGCNSSTGQIASTTVTLAGLNAYTSTAIGGNQRYKINNGPWTVVADAGSFTTAPGNVITVLWGNGSNINGGYFSDLQTYTVPCTGAIAFNDNLYTNGTISAAAKDNYGTLIALASNNWSVAQSSDFTGTITLQNTVNTAFPYGFIGVVEFNKTALQNFNLFPQGSASQYASATVPSNYTQIFASAISLRKAYTLPALMSNGQLTMSDEIIGSSNLDPQAGNVTITLYPLDYLVGATTNLPIGPVAENTNFLAAISGALPSVAVYYQ